MMIFLTVLALAMFVFIYIGAAFITGFAIQDWINRNSYWGPVAIPWLWTCFWVIAVPIAAVVSLAVENAP